MITIKIPEPTPSANELRRRYKHPQAYKRLREGFQIWIQAATRTAERCAPGERRTVAITRYSSKALDVDNLIGGCKPLIDALTRAGLIEDDRPDCIALVCEQRKTTRRDAHTTIEILGELEPADGGGADWITQARYLARTPIMGGTAERMRRLLRQALQLIDEQAAELRELETENTRLRAGGDHC